MEFEQLLLSVKQIIETEHRVAYRALKRRFDISDDDIEDLKAELIDAKQIADDENGAVLVARYPQKDRSPDTGILQEADRRLLTVMFCDIVGSTRMAERFEPEDLRDLVRRYQEVCGKAIESFNGHVAQYLGDGLLVYFGYPLALEDEANCAIRAALKIMDSLESDEVIVQTLGEPMRVRIGIHTGPVVVGEMGVAGRNEHLALGDTPNVAARIQSAAKPGQVLISRSTQHLTEGFFESEALGAHALKGVANDLELFRIQGESAPDKRFEVALSTGRLARFVGRKEELALLEKYWSEAKSGEGRAISLTAEPGFGKTRIVEEFKSRIGDTEARTIVFRCSPYHNTSAYYPLIQVLENAFQFEASDTSQDKVEKVRRFLAEYQLSDPDACAVYCHFLGLPNDNRKQYSTNPKAHRALLSKLLIELFLEESKRKPVFMVWDDLHWADPSTLELLDQYLDHVPGTATLAMIIYRADFPSPWEQDSYFRALHLNRLTRSEVESMVNNIAADQPVSQSLLDMIEAKTDGVPLFVEELTRSILDLGPAPIETDLVSNPGAELILIPETLQDLLEARIDRCVGGKVIAQWGATIGREFSYEVLRRVVNDDVAVNSGINELLDSDLIYRSGSISDPRFIFKHALLRDTAYESLLLRKRRQYHAQIGTTLATLPAFAESQPEVIAHHYTEGELLDDAVRWWHQASLHAISRSADAEATGHLHKALAIVGELPRTSDRIRIQDELEELLTPLVIDDE